MSKDSSKPSVWHRIRANFLTGLLVLAPLVITAYVVWQLFVFVDHLLGTTLRGGYIRPGGVPGLGFITVLVLIFLVGVLANNFLGRQVGNLIESMLRRLPVFRSFYSTVKQVGEALIGEKKEVFQRVVLIEYPLPGTYSLGFVTASVAHLVKEPGGRRLVAVFIPTPPNPTNGPLVLCPEESVIPTTLKVEQAIKMIISAGVVTGE